MTRGGINSELLKLVSSPPAWAMESDGTGYHPYFLTKHREIIASFLDATTDSVRLVRASKASRAILNEYDMAELEDLRATIQASEMLRVISYPKQTDHSAHTLYLYLLGIYLFFASAPLRAGVAKFLRERDNSPKLLERFLFQWIFVSLLHDIGYIFQGRSRNEIRAVDRMFRPSTITRIMGSASHGVRNSVSREITGMKIKALEPIQNPEDMLAQLRHIPWGYRARFADDIFESFHKFGPRDQQITSNDLEDYVYQVASSGYDGFSEGTVDHAIASGLFLFRYSTFWYWLAAENSFEGLFAAFQDDGYPHGDIVCACFATAAHNLIGVHAKQIPTLNFLSNPFIYLGILCDELQKWDRFPAGEQHIADLQSFEKHCTDSERMTLTGSWDGDKVVIRLEEEELASSIQKTLKRIASIETFVQINPLKNEEVIPPKDNPAASVSTS